MPNILSLNTDEQKTSYLNNLFTELYLIDIKVRNRLRGINEISELINVLASSASSLVNPRKLKNTFKSNSKTRISQVTIANYLEFLEQAFIIKKSVRYDVKGKKYIKTPAKYYFADVGLMNARLNFRQTEDKPHIMENMIFNELRFKGYSVDVGVVSLTEKKELGLPKKITTEVDFVANLGSKRYYIQSAFSIPTIEKAQQEKRPLNAINDSFKKIIITGENQIPRRDEKGILTIGIEDFITKQNSLEL